MRGGVSEQVDAQMNTKSPSRRGGESDNTDGRCEHDTLKAGFRRGHQNTKLSKTHHVPEKQLNSLQQWATLAYLPSCQGAGLEHNKASKVLLS